MNTGFEIPEYVGWIIVAAATVAAFDIYIIRSATKKRKRTQLLSARFDDGWKTIIEKNVPVYNKLPEELKKQLYGLMNVFLDEKKFEGCGGLEITNEIRVTVAAQACMLLLNRSTKYYPKLKRIYVYPSSYTAKDGDSTSARLGESWLNGPVVLAWDSVKGGAVNVHDGKNVVFHEFSHRLDQEDGDADGAPILENSSCYKSWAKVLSAEYAALQDKTNRRRKSVINKYGATNPAEFFAVATEAFFEKTKQMKKKQPELYEELKGYYKVDPLEWK